MSALRARIKPHDFRQHEGQSVQDHIKESNALYDAVKEIDGGQEVGTDSEMFEEVERLFQSRFGTNPSDPNLLERHNDTLSSCSDKLMLATIALRLASTSKYNLLKAELNNQHNLGQNSCPETFASVSKVSEICVRTKGVSPSPTECPEGVGFYQVEEKTSERHECQTTCKW